MNIVGVLTAAALLAGQLSALVHVLVVDHQRCPEHGELVHASLRRSPIHATGPVPVGRATGVAPADAATEDPGDDHCLSLAHRRETLVRAAVDEMPFVVQAAVRALASPRAVVPVPRLWMLAPKTSPPIAL